MAHEVYIELYDIVNISSKEWLELSVFRDKHFDFREASESRLRGILRFLRNCGGPAQSEFLMSGRWISSRLSRLLSR